MPSVEEVFDAGDYPEYTYVRRERRRLDERLERVLGSSTPGASIIGPSKSGKTALVKNTAREKDFTIIQIRGPQIGSVDELWSLVLDELGAPETTEEHRGDTTEDGRTTTAGAKPGGTGIDHAESERDTSTTGQTRSFGRRGLRGVKTRSEVADFVLLIDDFHYIDSRELKKNIVQSIKGAIEDKIPVCVAFVTHRGETLQELVPDIDDRVMSIPCDLWATEELVQIAEKGQDPLNIRFTDEMKEKLADNAIRSPMIMQRLCSAACAVAGISGTHDPESEAKEIDLSDEEFDRAIERAADWMGKRSVVREMAGGVNDSGRVEYDYGGQQDGDTYILGLRAIAQGDTDRNFHFSDLKQRMQDDCVDDSPNGPQIENFCSQMERIAKEERPNEDLVEWDNEKNVLTISDPELLFLIRYLMRDDDFQMRLAAI